MPFLSDIFTHLFDWEKDPQRQEKIINARLEAEFDGVDTGLSAVAARVTNLEDNPAGREALTADRTYYVRIGGSDSNTGLVNNDGGAFLTIQKAIDVAAALDSSIYSVTIQIADGTYTGANQLKCLLGPGILNILGNTGTPANVVISTTSANCFASFAPGGQFSIRGLKMQTTTAGYALRFIHPGSRITFDTVDFGAVAAGHAQISCSGGATVAASGNYSISGGVVVGQHIQTGEDGYVNIAGRTITLTGTPAFGTFVQVENSALLFATSITFSGGATGSRFTVNTMGNIVTAGGGASYFPGDSAGTEGTPDLYT